MISVFNQKFDSVVDVIEFNPKWKNTTGYLDGAVEGEHAPLLPVGQSVKCVDDHKRKVIITCMSVKDHATNIVIFERYTPSEDSQVVIVSNATMEVYLTTNLLANGRISEDELSKFYSMF